MIPVLYRQRFLFSGPTNALSLCNHLTCRATEMKILSSEKSTNLRRGCEAPSAMAAPVRTNQVNQVIRHPRTTFVAAIVNVNKRSVSADARAFTIHPKLSTRCRSI